MIVAVSTDSHSWCSVSIVQHCPELGTDSARSLGQMRGDQPLLHPASLLPTALAAQELRNSPAVRV